MSSERIAKLPLDPRGFPIPWFAGTLPSGERDFTLADYEKRARAVRHNLCWVCGEPVGKYKVFVIGPMCSITRTTSEPACHLDCAEYSATHCPFLTKPNMKRNVKAKIAHGGEDPPGIFLERNPGVTVLWTTLSFKVFRSPRGGWLITMGDPVRVSWYRFGKQATHAEVMESIMGGYPLLMKEAERDGPDAVGELERMKREFINRWLP